MVEAAIAMASRVLSIEGDDTTRIVMAFRLATARVPDAVETRSLKSLLHEGRQHYLAHPAEAEMLVGSSGDLAPEDQIQRAAWTGVTRAILNLYETVARY
jgi:hypothetical protein